MDPRDAQRTGIAYERAITQMGDVSAFCPELPPYLVKNLVAIAIAHAAQDGLNDVDALARAGLRAVSREKGRQARRSHQAAAPRHAPAGSFQAA